MKYVVSSLLCLAFSLSEAAAQQTVPPLKREFLDSAWHVLPSAAGARYRRETAYTNELRAEVRDYYLSGQLQSREQFENVQQRVFDGVSEYFYASGKLKMRREFQHGKRVGEIVRYYESGQLMLREHFADDKKMTNGEYFKEDGTPDNPYVFASLPVYSEGDGGKQAVVEAIAKRFNYPRDAQKARIQGRLLLSFEVTEQGDIENIQVTTGLYPSIDKEAIRAINQLAKFSPALEDGRPIKIRYTVPLSLTLR
jgi:protein TonB